MMNHTPTSLSRSARSLVAGLPRTVVGLLLLGSIALNFINVVARYGFDAPIVWADEILTYLVIWFVFLGACLVAWRDDHLRIDVVSGLCPPPVRPVLALVSTVATVGISLFMTVQAYEVISLMVQTGQRSTAAGIPMTVPHAALLVGFLLIALVQVVRWRAHLLGKGSFQEGQ